MHLLADSQQYFAAVSADNRLKVWDVTSGALQHELKERDHLSYKYTCMAWSNASHKVGSKRAKAADAGLIALGTSTGAIVLWDLQKGEVRATLVQEAGTSSAAIRALAFNSQGSLLYASSSDKTVLEWNVRSSKVTRSFRCGSEGASALSVSPDDELLAVGGTALRVFDLASGKKSRKFTAGLSATVDQLAFSPCKRFLFATTVAGRFVNMHDLQASDSEEDVAHKDEPVRTFALPASSAASLFVRVESKKKKSNVALGVVSATGALLLWRHSVKTGSRDSQPVVHDARTSDEARVLAAQPSLAEPAQQLLVVRGSLAKPVFATVSLVDDQQQFLDTIELAPLSDHLLLDGAENGTSKRAKQTTTEVHVPTLAETSGLATARAVVDATNGNDHDQSDEENEDEDQELTLAERVEALRERVENDVAAVRHLATADDDQDAAPRDKPDASSLASVLAQALQSRDNAMLEYCLRTRDAKVISNTIRRVASVKVLELLEILVIKFQKSPGRCARLCPWIRSILLHHTAYLMTQPELVQNLSALYQILENRLKVHDQLQKLAGRLCLVIGQIQESSGAAAAQGDMADADAPRAKIVYHEGADEITTLTAPTEEEDDEESVDLDLDDDDE